MTLETDRQPGEMQALQVSPMTLGIFYLDFRDQIQVSTKWATSIPGLDPAMTEGPEASAAQSCSQAGTLCAAR